jgi:hypothetical protein
MSTSSYPYLIGTSKKLEQMKDHPLLKIKHIALNWEMKESLPTHWFLDSPFVFFLDSDLRSKSPLLSLNTFKRPDTIYVFSSVYRTLSEQIQGTDLPASQLFGLNTINTFIQSPKMEMVALKDTNKDKMSAFLDSVGIGAHYVDDSIGMVTPRVVAKIINEAYLMLQEGTADEAAIDTAMKLGTNYPFGPFEWAEKIGYQDVCQLLKAIGVEPARTLTNRALMHYHEHKYDAFNEKARLLLNKQINV